MGVVTTNLGTQNIIETNQDTAPNPGNSKSNNRRDITLRGCDPRGTQFGTRKGKQTQNLQGLTKNRTERT